MEYIMQWHRSDTLSNASPLVLKLVQSSNQEITAKVKFRLDLEGLKESHLHYLIIELAFIPEIEAIQNGVCFV